MFAEAVKYTRKLADVSPLKDMIGTSDTLLTRYAWTDVVAWVAVNETNPGPEVKDETQIRDWIKKCLNTTWREYPVTCCAL